MKPGLTALGTAAVLGIYAAGFTLTREAAHGLDGAGRDPSRSTAQLDGSVYGQESGGGTGLAPGGASTLGGAIGGDPEGSAGQAPAEGPPGARLGAAAGAPLDRNAAAASQPTEGTSDPTRAGSGTIASAPQGPAATSGGAATRSASAVAGTGASGTTSGSGLATSSPSSSSRAEGATTGSSSPSASPGSSASSSQGTPSRGGGSTTTSSPAGSTTAPAEAPESPYLDGTYTAWGIRTGHGDIEATVEISGGRIASVLVSNCMMRWPCTDVNPLIGRIVRAQRPQVPVISGATQSSDAFTTAVTEALALARAAKTAPPATP